MLVWFGVQEALASAQGGPGFNMGKFLSFFMLITFAYTMVKFYDSSIPGIGYSLKGFINGGAQYLVRLNRHRQRHQILNTLQQAQSNEGPGMMSTVTNPYNAIIYALIQVLIAGSLRAYQRHHRLRRHRQCHRRIARADLHSVPCLRQTGVPVLGMAPRLPWLLASTKWSPPRRLSILSQLLAHYYTMHERASSIRRQMVKQLPVLILLVLVNGFILLKIPAMTATIFSGHTGGHDAGTGVITGLATTAATAALMG